AGNAGVPVVAHATGKEGMRLAALAGVATIEHGYDGDAEVYRLMANKSVALCPTLAAAEAMSKYRGWRPGTDPEPKAVQPRRACRWCAAATRGSSPTAPRPASWS